VTFIPLETAQALLDFIPSGWVTKLGAKPGDVGSVLSRGRPNGDRSFLTIFQHLERSAYRVLHEIKSGGYATGYPVARKKTLQDSIPTPFDP
jgi:hypothetical protein